MNFIKSRALSFHYAFAGWWYVIRTQRNAWIHALASGLVLLLALWLRLPLRDLAEFINTALEAVVDLTSPEIHPLARVGKDVGAAAVLIAALAAALVGVLILGPPLWAMLLNLLGG